ncbi:MAG: OsmC family protein [Gammaproteobacteria bacterium]|nr:OsmC family protein [Gammaproteobacteria bacterium]MDH3577338.1 OsmC family protein [Gammaproteobacteria bacterium]
MQDLPHFYVVSANADTDSHVVLSSEGLEPLETAGPPEFGGPGDLWSPETLLVGSVANCFILSFRAIARASRFEWLSLRCGVSGTLDKIERVTQFTSFDLQVELTVPPGTDEKKALRLLEKAEHYCLITNSMKAETRLSAKVQFAE